MRMNFLQGAGLSPQEMQMIGQLTNQGVTNGTDGAMDSLTQQALGASANQMSPQALMQMSRMRQMMQGNPQMLGGRPQQPLTPGAIPGGQSVMPQSPYPGFTQTPQSQMNQGLLQQFMQ